MPDQEGGSVSVGGVHMDIEPNAKGFGAKAKAQIDPQAAVLGRSIAQKISGPIAAQITKAIGQGVADGGRGALPAAVRNGEKIGAAFGKAMRARIALELKNLPAAKIALDKSSVDRSLAVLRAELAKLRDKTLTLDINIGKALAKIAAVRAALDGLSADLKDLRRDSADAAPFRFDTSHARSDLAAFRGDFGGLRRDVERPVRFHVEDDSDDARRNVDRLSGSAASAGRGISSLILAGALIAPVIVPAAAAAAAAVGTIGTAALGAGAGIGVLLLGFSGIGGAVSAMGKAQEEASTGASSLASRQEAVADAVERVADVHTALRNAELDAADAAIAARQRVEDSERSLGREQASLLVVQRDLNDAREEARRSLEGMAASLTGGLLAERQAAIELERVRARLQRVTDNKSSSAVDRSQAQLDFDEASFRLDEQKRKNKELAADKARADAAGVEGSAQVLAAQRRIADQTARVSAEEQDLADARRAQAAEARHSAASVASAQRAVVAAQRAVRDASVAAGAAGTAAGLALQQAMEGLSPAGQRFAKFLFSLKPALKDLRFAAQEGLLPGVEAGMRALLPFLPQLTRFVGNLAAVMGNLFEQGLKALTSPFWRQFFGYIGATAGPVIKGFASIIGNLIKAFAGITLAFAPVAEQLGGGLVNLTERFANWASTLDTNQGFQRFVAYVLEAGPRVMAFIGELFEAVFSIGRALAPIGGIALAVFTAILQGINAIPTDVLTVIIVGLLGIALAVKAVAIGFAIASSTLLASPVTWIVLGIVAALVLLVGGFYLAWKRSEAFRNAVKATWAGIKTAWETVLKPVFVAIGRFIRDQVAPAFLWLWRNAIKPAWDGIVLAVETAWEFVRPILVLFNTFIRDVVGPIMLSFWRNVIQPAWAGISLVISIAWAIIKAIFGAIVFVVRNFLAPIFMFLWTKIVRPVFAGIAVAIQIAWTIIRIIFGLLLIIIKVVVAPILMWLWRNVVRPVFEGIASVIKWVWENVIRPVFSAFGNFIKDKVAPAFARGVDAIGKAWDRIKDVAKIPIKFVIETVLNNGIIRGYNFLASKFGVPQVDPIPLPFARGGILPGYTPGRDVHRFYSRTGGMLDLSGGEAIMRPEFTAALGPDVVHALNRAARSGGVGGVRRMLGGGYQRFEDGGIFGAIKTAWDTFTDPAEALRKLVGGLLDKVPGGGIVRDLASKSVGRLLEGVTGWISKHLFGGGADAQVGGGKGNIAGWQNMWRWVHDHFSYTSLLSGFRPGDPLLHGSGRAIDIGTPDVLRGGPLAFGVFNAIKRTFFRNITELIYDFAGDKAVWNGAEHFFTGPGAGPGTHNNHIHWGMAGGGIWPGVQTFDQGGYLPPGVSLTANMTGRPEPVLTDSQWQRMQAGRGSTVSRTTNVYPQRTDFTLDDLQALQRRQETLDRVGRPS